MLVKEVAIPARIRNGTSVQNAFVGTIGGFQRVDGTALYQAGGYVPQPLPLWG